MVISRQGSSGDRFATWPRTAARLVLIIFAALLVASAVVPIEAAKQDYAQVGFVANVTGAEVPGAERPRDPDLALYDRVIARVAKGENYYTVVAQEHRLSDYPLRPGFAVRLPTLAYLCAVLGHVGQVIASLALLVAIGWAWRDRLKDAGCTPRQQRLGLALILFGASLGLNRYFFVLHELWAGQLLLLSLGLHRPGRRWGGALATAALAVAIREHALPFVLLMAAVAAWHGFRREALAWAGLAVVAVAGMAWHLHLVSQQVLPSDPVGPSWLVLRGLSGWLSNVVLTSNLRFLPHYLAGPLVMLAMLGWAGWRGPLGLFGSLLFAGYALLFMVAGRPDNYYWGAVIAPGLFLGLVFAPQALQSLWRQAGLGRVPLDPA